MVSKIDLRQGDCLEILKKIPDNSVNMIFADPPYNLSGKRNVTCKNCLKQKPKAKT